MDERWDILGGSALCWTCKELADVIHYTIAIAAVNGIDLESHLEKDPGAAIKYNHTTHLTEFQKTANTTSWQQEGNFAFPIV